jgi:hypothetical protein
LSRVGPATEDLFITEIAKARTIIWNGPMGVFEMPAFAHGTTAIAEALAENAGATTIVGGGDSVSAVKQAGVAEHEEHEEQRERGETEEVLCQQIQPCHPPTRCCQAAFDGHRL